MPQASNSATHLTTTSLSAAQMIELMQSKDATIQTQQQQIDVLKQQLEWFKRQVFGQKSERFALEADPSQMHLGEVLLPVETQAPAPRQAVPAHTRRLAQRAAAANEPESLPFFDESRVPVETIEVYEPEIAALAADVYEVPTAHRPPSCRSRRCTPLKRRSANESSLGKASGCIG
jgi:transposase